MSTLALADGRVLNGIVAGHAGTGPTLTLQTANERLTIPRDDVEETRASELSLMPDGLLDVLSDDQVRDLIAYLMTPRQVPLPPDSATDINDHKSENPKATTDQDGAQLPAAPQCRVDLHR